MFKNGVYIGYKLPVGIYPYEQYQYFTPPYENKSVLSVFCPILPCIGDLVNPLVTPVGAGNEVVVSRHKKKRVV